MMPKLLFLCGALGVALLTVAVVLAVAMGFIVWLGGSSWARQPRAGSSR
jgi:hypothetical protein